VKLGVVERMHRRIQLANSLNQLDCLGGAPRAMHQPIHEAPQAASWCIGEEVPLHPKRKCGTGTGTQGLGNFPSDQTRSYSGVCD